MEISVKVHEKARRNMVEWSYRLAPDEGDSIRFADLYFGAMKLELIRTRGYPANARLIADYKPGVMVWEFQLGSYWVIYTLQKHGGLLARLLGKSMTKIVIPAIQPQDPSQSTIASLTRELSSRG